MHGFAAAVALAPVVVHDSRERSPLASVGARHGSFAEAPVVYQRTAARPRSRSPRR